MKRVISVLISISMILLLLFPVQTLADSNDNITITIANYKTDESNQDLVNFTIYSMDEKEFKGHLIVKDSTGIVNVDTDVEGKVSYYGIYYVCFCTFKTSWTFVSYNSNATITVYPYEGTANVGFGGEGWIATLGEYTCKGTVDKYYEPNLSFNKKDMQMCMALSNAMYKWEKENYILTSIYGVLDDFYPDADDDEIEVYGYTDSNGKTDSDSENAPFSIMNRKRKDGVLDIIVSVRGTYKEEWIGNTELTGKEYNSSITRHYNFGKGKEFITSYIKNYYDDYKNDYENINLIVTGHSRGAAIANLYAKDATDVMNGEVNSDSIPCFDKVTAYTFACPNVEKVTDSNTVDKMRSYNNIYNFWFESDIVPAVPLTSPADGWNYWKFGRCYTMDISNYKRIEKNYFVGSYGIYYSAPINKNIKSDMDLAFSQWESVDDYYNKEIRTLADFPTTLYHELHSGTGLLGVKKSSKFRGVMGAKNILTSYKLKPLISFAINNLDTIKLSHDYYTYNSIINGALGYDNIEKFSPCSYEFIVNDFSTTTVDLLESDNAENNYNLDEAEALKQLALIDGNAENLGWDLSDLSTWSGVIWNDDGHVISLDFTYKWLTGSFDFSVFSQLQDLNLYANSLKEIKLNNDSLTMLNCSFNDLSENGLDLSNCGSLTELYCDGCSLSTLDLRGVPELEVLSCSFNNLISLNIENNSRLNHISCPYNYLDMHEGGVISTLLNKYKTENNAYVNNKPQLLLSDAVTDSDELAALETFAKIGDNNSSLDWLDNNGDISIDKLQNNAYFDYDGEKYRISAIDISDMNVEGKLDLSAFSELSAVYCENTGVSSLVLTDCTKVETIDCRCSKISELILPSNIKNDTSRLSEIDCEYNYIDTKIFTNDIINHIKSNEYYILNYINQRGDSSALQAAVSYSESLEEADYSKSSFAQLNEILCECKSYDYDNLYLTQADIDSLTADILTKIYNLKAFLNAKISAENGIVKVFYDETELEDSSLSNSGGVIELPPDTEGFTVYDGSDTFSVLFGTTVTLTATPKEGYSFVGWYNSSSNRYISTENPYTFKATANADIKAVFASDGDATLTFLTPSNQVVTTVSKFAAEWTEVGTINDLLPDVPFKYGCKNGRWEYNEADVLSKLRNGENVSIVSAYDKSEFTVPSPRNAEDKPALDLYYNYDDESSIGSFIMTTGFPENIKVESVGIAYYFKAADSFNPKDYILTLNNKVRTSKFGTDKLYDYYIMNMKNINDKNNWSVRGYVAYYDSDNNLQVEYSNQINIVNNIADRCAVRNDSSATQLPPDEI